MPRHSFTNFEVLKRYQNEPSVYSRRNLPKIKDGAYVAHFNEYKSIETYWIALYMNAKNEIYFENLYCVICGKYKKFKKPKIP